VHPSEPAPEFDSEISEVLLNNILGMFRLASVKIFLVKDAINIGGEAGVLSLLISR
jgi:hypothetical protein